MYTLTIYFYVGSMFAAQRSISFNALSKCVNQLNVASRLGNKTLTVSVKCKKHNLDSITC